MIDIHHHLFYGLDDGSPDLDTSLAMAEAAAADGITHIVCTPHANETYRFQPEVNLQQLTALQEKLGDRITLGSGSDFHLTYENIQDAIAHPEKYSINGKGYLLVEFSDLSIPHNISDMFFQLSLAGHTIIITHPERNPLINRGYSRLAEWVRQGCLIQVTAAALTGRFGRTAAAYSNELLRRNWIHFLATDAHNLTSRPPQMRAAYDYVVEVQGTEAAERLFVTNPRCAFEGTPLPAQPEPLQLWEKEEKKKGGFFRSLFSSRSNKF